MKSFSPPRFKTRKAVLKSTTVREFGGGWNIVDSEQNLSQRYSVLMDNVSREEDGSIGVRWGTRIFADIHDVNFIDPADLSAFAPDGGTVSASYNGNSITTVNDTAFWDGTLDQAMAASTSAAYVGHVNGDTATLVCETNYTSSVLTDTLAVHAPQEGFITGDAQSSAFVVLTLDVQLTNGGPWELVEARNYSIATLPSIFFVTAIGTEPSPIALFGVRFTVELSDIIQSDNITMGIAEISAAEYTGSGVLPADVHIVNMYYFQDSVISVLTNGTIVRTLANGVSELVWSSVIAAGLVGAPSGWSTTDFASFAIFNGKLIVCNGIDKPLTMTFDNTVWITNRIYAVNDVVLDPIAGDKTYRCAEDHVSDDFATDLAAVKWVLETTGVFPVKYLGDPGDNDSNLNVPICRYVLTMNRYVVMGGDVIHPDRLHISSEGTDGVWYGAPGADNSAIYVDLGTYGVQGEQTITGLDRYREQLIVGFWSAVIIGRLGIFDAETGIIHTPDFTDVVENVGCHSHRSMVNIGKDLYMMDHIGVPSMSRSLYSGETEPKRVSELIDPALNANIARLTDEDSLLKTHAVFNGNDKQYMLFVPNYSPTDSLNLIVNALSIVPDRLDVLRITSYAHGMLVGDKIILENVTAFNTVDETLINGIEHQITRIVSDDMIEFMPAGIAVDGAGTAVGGGDTMTMARQLSETIGYIYTVVDELKIKAWSRYRGWNWVASAVSELGRVLLADQNKIYVLGYDNDPIHSDFINDASEQPIEWAWELPWGDFNARMALKHNRYMQLDTSGTATFTAMMFADNLYKLDGEMYPVCNAEFVGGDIMGYGDGPQPFGGGRTTSDQRLYAWTARFKLGKLRFQGSTTEPLRIVAITLAYQSSANSSSIRR